MRTLTFIIYLLISLLYFVVIINFIKSIKNFKLDNIKNFWFSPDEVDDE